MSDEVVVPVVTPEVQPTVQPNVVAPVTPQVPNVPVETPVATPAEVDYTGNTVLETSINVFAGSAGIEASRFDSAIENALRYSDESLIDYRSLSEGLKPEQASQAKALVVAQYRETQAFLQTETAAVHTLAGGKEQWAEAASVFNSKAPAHIKAAVSQMLDNGQLQHAAQVVLDTVKGAGMVSSGNTPLQGGTGVAIQQGITQAEYFEKLSVLERAAGNRSFESGEYGQKLQLLTAERKLGRERGL